jgi:MoxR-like ATPase
VTIGDTTFKLDRPFLVLATQNPIEQEGTYQLPEAQVDRFMLKTVIDYPKMDEERMVVRQNLKGSYEKVNQVVSVEQIYGHKKRFAKYTWMKKSRNTSLISFCHSIPRKYKLADLKPLISFGASPWKYQFS